MSYADLFSTASPLVGYRDTKAPVVTVFGVPYDGTTSYRPGTRFGPNAIREAFMNCEVYSKYFDIDVEKVPIRDLGNLGKINAAEQMVGIVTKVAGELFKSKSVFCMLGGEHFLTLGSYRMAPEETALVAFDAHFGLRDEWEGSVYLDACYLKRVIDAVDPSHVAHIGGRAAAAEEWRLSERLGYVASPERAETTAGLRAFRRFCSKFDRVYVSIDIDCLDPAYAPGTGTLEAGGLSPTTVLDYIYSLSGKDVVAFDIMEVSPHYDTGITAVVAARFMNELIALIASRLGR